MAIPLHDTIRAEASKVARSAVVNPDSWQAADPSAVHLSRLTQLESDCEVLTALVATTVYWGDPETDGWWFDLAQSLSRRPHVNGLSNLIGLARAPGLLVAFAAGVAACARQRDDLVTALVNIPRCETFSGLPGPLLQVLDVSEVIGMPDSGKRVHEYLKPIIADQLGRGAAYFDDWDRWQVLVAIAMVDARNLEQPTGAPSIPYVRVSGSLNNYHSVVGDRLRQEVSDVDHPLMVAGLCGGDVGERFEVALSDLEAWINLLVYGRISSQIVREPFSFLASPSTPTNRRTIANDLCTQFDELNAKFDWRRYLPW